MPIVAPTRPPPSSLSVIVALLRGLAVFQFPPGVLALLDELATIVVIEIELKRCKMLVPKKEELLQRYDRSHDVLARLTILRELQPGRGTYFCCLLSSELFASG